MNLATLRTIQQQQGAQMGPGDIPLSFGKPEEAIVASQTGVALGDSSHWGRLWVTGDDRLRFLHNQSTNQFQTLQPGQGCETVFVTSTARTLDLATAYVLPTGVLVLVSPERTPFLLEWLDRYIFPFDQVKLQNLTDTSCCFTLIGPESSSLLRNLGIESLPDPLHAHECYNLASGPVRIARGSGLASPGYTLILPAEIPLEVPAENPNPETLTLAEQAGHLWQTLVAAGAVPLGTQTWEQLRIQQGRPVPDRELTEDYNPLEAGLWQRISFEKGCYIGQETIARLNTYQGVKQRLWGLRLPKPVAVGTPLRVDEEKVGIITSITPIPEGFFGLAYLRSRVGGAGLSVQVGDTTAEVVAVPFLNHPEGGSLAGG